MENELTKLQMQLAQISAELAAAQQKINKLKMKRNFRLPIAFLLVCFGLTALSYLPSGTSAQQVPQPIPGNVESQILNLYQRVTALENREKNDSAKPRTVTAPFTVVNKAGQPIFKVGEFEGGHGISIIGKNPNLSATLAVVDNNAALELKSGENKSVLTNDSMEITDGTRTLKAISHSLNIGVGDEADQGRNTQLDLNGLYLSDGDSPRAQLLQMPEGNTALRIMNNSGKTVASLGVNREKAGAGALKIGDSSGSVVASVAGISSGRGSVDVFNSGGQSIASIGAESDGRGLVTVRNNAGMSVASLAVSDKVANAGRLTVNDAAGNGVFSAGYDGEQGAACVNRKNGLWCVGVNLPLTIGTSNLIFPNQYRRTFNWFDLFLVPQNGVNFGDKNS